MAEQYSATATQKLPESCVVDITPPTFTGIASLVVQLNGSLLATWLAGSDATLPLEYEIYIKEGTATGLFSTANIAYITKNLSLYLFQLASGQLLEAGQTYYVGVRAKDAVGNRDNNLVSLFAVSTGVLTNTLAEIAQQILAASNKIAGGLAIEIADNDPVTSQVESNDPITTEVACD